MRNSDLPERGPMMPGPSKPTPLNRVKAFHVTRYAGEGRDNAVWSLHGVTVQGTEFRAVGDWGHIMDTLYKNSGETV